MKAQLFTLFLFLSFSTSYAQVGISGGYLSGYYFTLESPLEMNKKLFTSANEDLWSQGYKIGVDYWFRLKPVRIEFLPEIGWSSFQSDLTDPSQNETLNSQFQSLHFQANINIYPFDFVGDCDCPTFSKSEPIFQRGFFVQLAPGINYQTMRFTTTGYEFEHAAWNYSLAGGVGLDLGVSDLLTLTPYAKFWYFISQDRSELFRLQPFPSTEPLNIVDDAVGQLELGLRLGLRFDQ